MGVVRLDGTQQNTTNQDATAWGQQQLASLYGKQSGPAIGVDLNPSGYGSVPGRSATGSKVQLGTPMIPVTMPTGFNGMDYGVSDSSSANAAEHTMTSPKPTHGVVAMDPASAKLAIFGWSDAEREAFAKRVWYLGGIDNPNDTAGAINAWQDAVDLATGFAAMGKPVDPSAVLDMLLSGDPNAMKARERRKSGGVVTQKARSINVASPTEARLLIEQAYKARMGRDATDAELNTLTASLQAAQRQNPSLTTTDTKLDSGGNVTSQSSVTTGGLDPQGFVDQQFDNNPDAAEYEASKVYFPLLMNLLGSPVGK